MAKGLTRERIVAVALQVVDEGGLEALSMRGVARCLNVEAMSLYRYVRNKADLQDALYDHLVGLVHTEISGDWPEQVRQIATAFRELLFAHPHCVPLLATRAGTTPRALRVLEHGVGIFRTQGWSEERSVIAFQAVFSFVVGHAVFHTAGGAVRADDTWTRHEFAEGLELLIAGLVAQDRIAKTD